MKLEAVNVRHSAFERCNIPIYCLMVTSFVGGTFFLLYLGMKLTPAMATLYWLWPFVAVAGILARRIQLMRVGDALEGIALLYGQALSALFLIYCMAAVSRPYADALLAGWDSALNLDWPGYIEFLAPYSKPLNLAYKSFRWQPLLLVCIFVLLGYRQRLWSLALAAAIACLLTALVFPLVPARGVYLYHELDLSKYPALASYDTWKFDASLDYLKGGGRVLDPSILTGLVSFPSYHSAEAVQFLWAAWAIRWLRWPFVFLNVLVLIATPVVGAHYFVDVFAGIAIGIISICIASRLVVFLSQTVNPRQESYEKVGR